MTTTAALSASPEKPKTKPAPVQKVAPARVAPADEYFGKLKMSILGIRNTIKDVGANIEIDQTRWEQQASKAAFAEDAMHDWERKYPTDTWLAKTVFSLERMYAKLDTDEGRRRSVATMKWLIHDFPKTWYGRTGKRELAQGKVGRAPVNMAAQSPAPQQQQPMALPAALASSAPSSAAGTTAANGVSPEQTAGNGPAVPNPAPSVSPAAPNRHE